MRLVTAIFLTIAMLAGCQMHSDEEYRNLEKSYKELKAQKFAVELERESNEKNLEIAIACNTLPINICPQDWTNINMESYLRAGYIGKPTWRYWLILIGGLIERLLAAGCIGVGFALFLKKMLEPDSAAVEEAKKTISMAKIEGDRIQERINKVAETERATLVDLKKRIETAKSELDEILKDEQEQKNAYDKLVSELNQKIELLRKEVAILEHRKSLFGG